MSNDLVVQKGPSGYRFLLNCNVERFCVDSCGITGGKNKVPTIVISFVHERIEEVTKFVRRADTNERQPTIHVYKKDKCHGLCITYSIEGEVDVDYFAKELGDAKQTLLLAKSNISLEIHVEITDEVARTLLTGFAQAQVIIVAIVDDSTIDANWNPLCTTAISQIESTSPQPYFEVRSPDDS